MANGTMKTIFGFNNKNVAYNSAFNVSDSLLLTRFHLMHSLNTLCSPPETSRPIIDLLRKLLRYPLHFFLSPPQ